MSHLGCPDGPERRSMTTFPGDGAEKDEYQPVDQETAGHGCVQLNVAVVPAEAGVLGAIFRFLLGLGGI